MKRTAVLAPVIGAAVFLAACGGGGGGGSGAPEVALGRDVCAECGMTIEDGRFTAALRAGPLVRVFDAIECAAKALRKQDGSSEARIWLADFETGVLHPDSLMTVVRGGYPSPMGAGLAAFVDPARAAAEARERDGVTGTLADVVRGSLGKGSAR